VDKGAVSTVLTLSGLRKLHGLFPPYWTNARIAINSLVHHQGSYYKVSFVVMKTQEIQQTKSQALWPREISNDVKGVGILGFNMRFRASTLHALIRGKLLKIIVRILVLFQYTIFVATRTRLLYSGINASFPLPTLVGFQRYDTRRKNLPQTMPRFQINNTKKISSRNDARPDMPLAP